VFKTVVSSQEKALLLLFKVRNHKKGQRPTFSVGLALMKENYQRMKKTNENQE